MTKDIDQKIKIEILRLYLSSKQWSHRKLQSEILDLDVLARGGGFLCRDGDIKIFWTGGRCT